MSRDFVAEYLQLSLKNMLTNRDRLQGLLDDYMEAHKQVNITETLTPDQIAKTTALVIRELARVDAAIAQLAVSLEKVGINYTVEDDE